MHQICYGAAPTEGQRALVNDQEGLGVRRRDKERRFAIEAYPKIRARVLIRHKRLYLASTRRNRMLFKLPRASVCKQMRRAQDKAGNESVTGEQ